MVFIDIIFMVPRVGGSEMFTKYFELKCYWEMTMEILPYLNMIGKQNVSIIIYGTLDTIGNCQRLAFTVGVSQHMHKITNL